MTSKLNRISSMPIIGFGFNLNPAPAWIAIFSFVLISGVCLAIGFGKILNLAFPAGALLVGVVLYFRAPVLYVGFCWWICFLSPFVRRFSDFRSGYTDPSPILIAPFLVQLVALITLWKYPPRSHRDDSMPFFLAIVAVFYGFAVGFLNRPFFAVLKAGIEWLAPIVFGLHLCMTWHSYPEYRRNIQRTFVWGILIMGIYGIIQYIFLPEWERHWIINSEFRVGNVGFDVTNPQPQLIRVYSTLNSPEPFAAYMAGGLLLLLSSQSILLLPASAFGYLSFLLSLVRSGWLGWGAGFLSMVFSLKAKFQIRLILIAILIFSCTLPLITMKEFSEVIQDRLSTLSDVQSDGSASGRTEYFQESIGTAFVSLTGEGLGGTSHDSSILAILFNFGLIAAPFYMIGFLLPILKLFSSRRGRTDPFISTTRAVIISALVRFPVNSPVVAASGMLFWGFLGIGIAAIKYNDEQMLLKRHNLP